MHPSLTGGNRSVVLAEKYYRRRSHSIEFIEWRFLDIPLWIFQWRFPEIIIVERRPEIGVGPIARPFDDARSGPGRLVPGGSRRECDGQQRAVRPPQNAQFVGVDK